MSRVLPLRIGVKDCFVLIMLVIFNTIQITDMANNDVTTNTKTGKPKSDSTSNKAIHVTNYSENEEYLKTCLTLDKDAVSECSALQFPCIECVHINNNKPFIDCQYGAATNYSCIPKKHVVCNGNNKFNRSAICRFCYQTEKWEHRCEQKANCNSVASPQKYYLTNCTVSDDIICMGKRRFLKKVHCSWTAGTCWGTALILALTLGGFGADRFYLGHWQEGIGKLFSFGGLGVWTLVDALLIGIHHLGPADGSLYI